MQENNHKHCQNNGTEGKQIENQQGMSYFVFTKKKQMVKTFEAQVFLIIISVFCLRRRKR